VNDIEPLVAKFNEHFHKLLFNNLYHLRLIYENKLTFEYFSVVREIYRYIESYKSVNTKLYNDKSDTPITVEQWFALRESGCKFTQEFENNMLDVIANRMNKNVMHIQYVRDVIITFEMFFTKLRESYDKNHEYTPLITFTFTTLKSCNMFTTDSALIYQLEKQLESANDLVYNLEEKNNNQYETICNLTDTIIELNTKIEQLEELENDFNDLQESHTTLVNENQKYKTMLLGLQKVALNV
jgi:hypothetical protein